MMPDPLHPAVVHLPLALAVLAPFVALLALVAIRRAWLPPRAWLAVVLLHALLAGSAWYASETGEDQEERVERVVRESLIEDHEEAAERFLWVTVAALAVSAGGLLRGSRGMLGRGATVAAAALALAAAVSVGHSGGELVYRYGAANAYVERAPGTAPVRAPSRPSQDDDD